MNRLRQKVVVTSLACLLFIALLLPSAVHGFGEGAKGPDVYAVQGMLKSLGSYAGEIDGSYGPLMSAGVRYFQQQYGLPVTGNVDAKTLESILWAYGELKVQNEETTPTPESQPDTTPSISAEEQRMIDLVNQERAKQGLNSLIPDAELSRVARIKSLDLIEKNYFAHESPTYGSPFDMMRSFGITYRTAGENLACNQTVDAAHQALMNSTGHRENILSPNYTHIGIGIVNGGKCGAMYTQMFVGR